MLLNFYFSQERENGEERRGAERAGKGRSD